MKERPDSKIMLQKFRFEEKCAKKEKEGKLKIFLGYAAGVGKTYAMLEAAHELQKQGIDVVAGYIEPHAREDTRRMAVGIETIPVQSMVYKGKTMKEFDLDAALKRKPQVILVDELAHSNVSGCRNEKRYQDIQELLRAGIDVWSTVNIQHLESLNDLVESITKIEVKERIPDSVFDQADQVEVIDIEPEELISRMRAGKIYHQEQVGRALTHFFKKEKLVALREIALRRTADRVNKIAVEERSFSEDKSYHIGEHVLVCISSAPSCTKVIRTAARLAAAFHAEFTGLYVETSERNEVDEKAQQELRKHIELAKELGAKIVTVFGSDVAEQIAEYAVVSNVSKVVIGRTHHSRFELRPRIEIMDKLATMAPAIDVYIIPDLKQSQSKQWHDQRRKKQNSVGRVVLDLLEITMVLGLTTLIAWGMQVLGLPESNMIMIYILGVLASSYIAYNKMYALYSALISVLAFNYFFTEPYFSLKAYDHGYSTTFFILFIVGLFAASMTRRQKLQSYENAKKAYRTTILLENSQRLRRCRSVEAVWQQLAGQVGKLLNLSLIIYSVSDDGVLGEPRLFAKTGSEEGALKTLLTIEERGVAQWVMKNRHTAGACTHTLSGAKAMYIPIKDDERVRGILGIYLEERRPIAEFEYSLLMAMINETGVKLQDEFL